MYKDNNQKELQIEDINVDESLKSPVLINKGSFGCVYYPNLPCNDDKEIDGDKTKYISKIQYKDNIFENENEISKIIKTIHNYQLFFAPLESTCSSTIDINDDFFMDKSVENSCPLLANNPEEEINAVKADADADADANANTNTDAALKKDNIVSTKIRFVGDFSIYDYLETLPKEIFFIKTKEAFSYVMFSIDLLIEKGIVHYDIKNNNIMYDLLNHSPIIIDFGLSFEFAKLNIEMISKIFNNIELFPFWCIDIYILSFFSVKISTKEKNFESSSLEEIIDLFYENLKKTDIFTEEELTNNKKENESFLKPFLNGTWDNLLKELLKEQFVFTWDKYCTCLTFISIMKSEQIIINENDRSTTFDKTLHDVVLCSPSKRKEKIDSISQY